MKKLSSKPQKENAGEKAAQDRITQTLKELLMASFTPFWWIRFLTVLVLFSISIHAASAQKADTLFTDSSRSAYCYYMKQSKIDKQVGFIFLVPGVSLVTIAAINESSLHKQNALYTIGGFMLIASLQAFISAGENRKKARLSLKIKTEKVGVGDIQAHASRYTGPALKLEF
jgi:uncharacterized membrane protein YfcA